MSLGYSGRCKKVNEDDTAVYYAYSGIDLNNPTHDKAFEKVYDGSFVVDKSITGNERIDALLADGRLVIINHCKNEWHTATTAGYIFIHLVLTILKNLRKRESLQTGFRLQSKQYQHIWQFYQYKNSKIKTRKMRDFK